ncbi:hypothetical protein SCG7109_AF_00020 [Chlamydiales bacterium SCGC AG-110-M15]|nr:hypothetical protein SCG7109_AF_00020 [Chlamydiales bacterium SCGC AG-110-M15]
MIIRIKIIFLHAKKIPDNDDYIKKYPLKQSLKVYSHVHPYNELAIHPLPFEKWKELSSKVVVK